MKYLKNMILGAMVFSFAVVPTATADDPAAKISAATPKALCHVYVGTGGFDVRVKPRHCDFYSALATPDTPSRKAIIPTKRVRWKRWGENRAYGRGRYHVSSVGWVAAKIRLGRSRDACGRRMFTRLQLRIHVPGGDWKPWGRKVPIRACPPY